MSPATLNPVRKFAFFICALTAASVASAQTKRALILGIDTYQPTGTTAQHDPGCTYGRCELGSFQNLEGAVNDAQSIADVLTSPKFGFPAANVTLLTNPAPRQTRSGEVVLSASDTTHDGILAAMKKYLVDVPQPGDTVVFYDASHGSLRVNTAGEKLTVRGDDGKLVYVDSTLVPSDAYKGGYDVRDREMTRIFNAALDKGVHLTIIFDSCHSGGLTRGLTPGRTRSLPYDPRPVTDPPDTLPSGVRILAPAERADNPALVFSAVQQDQEANEADPSPEMPEAHGAFTAALVETLQVLPANASASLVYQRVKAMLEGSGFANQEPDLDASASRRSQPLFGGEAGKDSGKVRTAVLKVNDSGGVWLDIGMVSGIGTGSEFTALSGGKSDAGPIKLRIDAPLGVARSAASIVSPDGAKVQVGDVFELSKLVPAQTTALKFWVGPSLPAAEITATVAQIKASGVATISDPAEEPYTDVLSWNGSIWTLRHAGTDPNAQPGHFTFFFGRKNGPVNLGAQLTAAALKSHLAANAKLWADLPPSRELTASLKLGDANSTAQAAASLADAGYVLAGSIVKGDAGYTWFHKNEYATVPHPSASSTPDHSPGCSTTSPYPVRTDWVTGTDAAAATLADYSQRLAKVHGWLQISNNAAAGASEANYFKLALVPMATTSPVDINAALKQNQQFRLALKADGTVKDPRWVYILDIDCHGKGSLIYPLNYSENQYPDEGDSGDLVILRHAPTLKVGAPYGIDTMVLLSTAQPLPDPSVLNFDGVARGATRGASNPLQQLLSHASSGSRGLNVDVEVPTDWGIETQSLRSVPQGAPAK